MPSFFSIICNAIQKVFNFLLFNHSQTSVLKLLPVQNIKSTHKNTALISRLTGHHSNCESALFPIIVREKKMKMSQSALASRCRAAYTRWHINKKPTKPCAPAYRLREYYSSRFCLATHYGTT